MTFKVGLQWGGAVNPALYIVNKDTKQRVARMEVTATAKRDALSIMSAMNALDVYINEIAKLKRRIEVLEAELAGKTPPLLPVQMVASVSVFDASCRLKCSTDTVIHRLAIGTLQGYRVRGKWRVFESCLPVVK